MISNTETGTVADTGAVVTELETPEKGKVRFLAGWVVYKELSFTSNYISRYKASTSKKVQKKIAFELSVLPKIRKFVITQSQCSSTTSFPETLTHMERYNRGGYTHIVDELYLFFVALEICCQNTFKLSLIRKYKKEAVKVARKQVREDPTIALAWRNLLNSYERKAGW